LWSIPRIINKATAVIVIHEIFGMSDWVQSLTDQLAEAVLRCDRAGSAFGYGPNGGGTSSLDRTAVGTAIRDLPPDQITADLNAVAGLYLESARIERQGCGHRIFAGVVVNRSVTRPTIRTLKRRLFLSDQRLLLRWYAGQSRTR
jgi:dienelactone hydrolase